MTREMNVMLFVLGAMDWLRAHGFADGKTPVTPRGTSIFDQLEASGFRPTGEDIGMAIATLRTSGRVVMDEDSADATKTLIENWDAIKIHAASR